MLKKLPQKTKRAFFLICLVSCFTVAFLAFHILYPYIGINLITNTLPFLSSGANGKVPFYGENIDMSQILPSSQHYIVNSKGQDLIDIAASLGINLVRITNAQRSFNNTADSVYTAAQWNQVLDKMHSKGMKAIILIETASNNLNYYTPDIRPVYLHLVQEYINSGAFANPDVYAVDIKNEPLLTNANVKMLQIAHTMIKAKYPDLKQTIGWWATPKSPSDPYKSRNYNWRDYAAGQQLAGIVDFYSLHMYGLENDAAGMNWDPDLKTKVFVSETEDGLQTDKPLLIEEFGAANGDAVSDQDTIGSPQLQAYVYQGVYQALKEMHSGQLMGAVAFDFYSRNRYPDAWAIVKNHGNYLFPAAYILQEFASGKNNPSLQEATVVTSQSYLVKDADNERSINLHVSDRIGLHLQLDGSNDYSLSLSASGILRPLELFHYDPLSASYYAVYQAVSKGSVQLNIVPKANCLLEEFCTLSVYTLTINVQ